MEKKHAKTRSCSLGLLLVERGFFASVSEAQRWVIAGQVLVNGQRIDKAGMKVSSDAELRILGRHRYASRGGYKLAVALDYFQIDVTGQVAVDCGASTGGFTDCLLQRGIALVYAVDVGFGQLLGRLQVDPRVHNLERTNLSDLVTMELDPPPTLVALDLSYLSLTKALPITAQFLPQGQIVALLKPLFEVNSPEARRTGKVDDPALLITALQQVLDAGISAGLTPMGITKLALRPRHGVNEFFVHFAHKALAIPWSYNTNSLTEIVASPGIGNPDEDA